MLPPRCSYSKIVPPVSPTGRKGCHPESRGTLDEGVPAGGSSALCASE